MFKQALIKATEQRILNELGSLRDLPIELANTVANIYYRYCQLFERMDGKDDGSIIEKIARSQEMARTYHTLMHQAAEIVLDYENSRKLINSLRKNGNNHPYYINEESQIALDVLKYHIPGAQKKSNFRRRFARRFSKVEEVNSLISHMNV